MCECVDVYLKTDQQEDGRIHDKSDVCPKGLKLGFGFCAASPRAQIPDNQAR